jgi:hypothetical protein
MPMKISKEEKVLKFILSEAARLKRSPLYRLCLIRRALALAERLELDSKKLELVK